MSTGEDIHTTYYSAILAKALKQDDQKFEKLYALICEDSSKEKANKAKEKAQSFAELPLLTLNYKIKWLEKLGVKPLTLPAMEEKLESSNDKVVEQILLELENGTSAEKAILKPQTSHTDNRVTEYIDGDDVEEVKSEPRSSPLPKSELLLDHTCPLQDNSSKFSSQCTIEMNNMPMHDNSCLDIDNYDTSDKTLFTAEDFGKEQLSKSEVQTSSRFPVEFSKGTSEIFGDEESKKNLKKKKKAKTRAEVVKNPGVYHPSDFDTHYRSLGNPTEVIPLLGSDSCSNNQSYTNPKPIKLRKHSKKAQAAAELKRSGSEEKADMSKAVNRNQVEQKKLSDAQVQEILEQLGDRSLKESLDSKKKSKEGKHNTVKKDKKKLKKQKKSEKKKKAEPEERSDTEESDIPPKPSATDDVFTVSTSVEVNEEEFVTPRKKKTSHKHPSSGRASPHKFETNRKRRYSDPSGTPTNSSTAMTSTNQASNKQDKANPEYKNWCRVEASAEMHNDSYDTSNAQWPTLTSQVESSSPRAVAAHRVDSYASKLKTNLDSRGCSLASSSEDGSSSSSSSTNSYQGRSGDRSSPVQNYITALSDISRTIQAAAGFVKEPSTRNPVAVEELPPPVSAVGQAAKNITSANTVKNAEKVKNAMSSCNKSSKQMPLDRNKCTGGQDKTGVPCSVPFADTRVTPFSKKEKTPVCYNEDVKDDIASENAQTDTILNALKNNFGLSFFMDEQSLLSDDVPAQLHCSSSFEKTNMQVTFGDSDISFDEMSKVASSVKASNPRTVQIPSLNVNIEFNQTSNWMSKVGDFDMKKATNTLMQEWKKAREKGTFYRDLAE